MIPLGYAALGDVRKWLVENRYISDELFHFVGHSSPNDDESNYQTLKKIIDSRCVSHAPHDDNWGATTYTINWDGLLETEQLIIPSVTCYADIPFEALSLHVNKYGKFGIGFPRSRLTRYDARPVMYIPMRSDDWASPNGRALLRDIEAAVKGFNESVVETLAEETLEHRRLGEVPSTHEGAISAVESVLHKDFLAFIKPFNSELPHNNPDNFYMEREWRKYGNMKFEVADISRVVVAKGFKGQALADFPAYADLIWGI